MSTPRRTKWTMAWLRIAACLVPLAALSCTVKDTAAPVETLTPAQRAVMCDWVTSQLGGYGFTTVCPDGVHVSTAMNQADCVANRFMYRCTVTVGQLETCTLAMAPSQGCELPNAECRALFCM